jgi:Txe/YoeB family toxin of Txe-Axe toxin-antitoxin module
MGFNSKFKPQFLKDIKKYKSYKERIQKKVDSIINDPYYNSEMLENRPNYNLFGLRSKRIDRNFRIIFAICEECRNLFSEKDEKPCYFCDKDLSDKTIIFFCVQPHEKVYNKSKPIE